MNIFESKSLNAEELEDLKAREEYPFYISEQLICFVDEKENGKAQLQGACDLFKIKKVVVNQENQAMQYQLLLYTKVGKKEITVDRSVFIGKRLAELVSHGFSYNPQMSTKIMRYAFQCEEKAEIISEYRSVGWSQNHAQEFLGLDQSYVGSMDLSECQGSEHYKSGLNKLIQDCHGSQLAVVLGLSSALFSYFEDTLHTGTHIFHFFGDSSCGKTTALILAASMWGNPEMGRGVFGTWNATDNAMRSALNGNFGVSVCFDEAGVIESRNYSDLIYSISQGKDRMRLNKDCKQQEAKSWCTTVLSSGENSLLDTSGQNTGLRARVSEFLDFPLTLSASHAQKIKTFCLENYGLMGREFVREIGNYERDFLLEECHHISQLIVSEIGSNQNLAERLSVVFAVLIVTAEILNEQCDLRVSVTAMKNLLTDHLKRLIEESLPLSNRAYDVILEWIANNQHKIQSWKGYEFFGCLAKYTAVNEIAIQSSTLKKILTDSGFSDLKVVAKSLKDAQLLHPEAKDGLQTRIKFGNTRVQCYRIVLKEDSSKDEKEKMICEENSSASLDKNETQHFAKKRLIGKKPKMRND